MNAESWVCPKCGEASEAQFDACWKCGAPRDGDVTQSEGETTETVDVTPEQMMAQMLQLQRQQRKMLDDIQSKVGCLFTYMVFGIIVGAIAALFSLTQM